MIELLLGIFEKYGINATLFSIVVFLLLYILKVVIKTKDNHLAHIQEAINSTCVKIDKFDEKLDCFGQRISNVEGKLEAHFIADSK